MEVSIPRSKYGRIVWRIKPAKTRRSLNAGLLLDQRRRRWANIKPVLVQRPLLTGKLRILNGFASAVLNWNWCCMVSNMSSACPLYLCNTECPITRPLTLVLLSVYKLYNVSVQLSLMLIKWFLIKWFNFGDIYILHSSSFEGVHAGGSWKNDPSYIT